MPVLLKDLGIDSPESLIGVKFKGPARQGEASGVSFEVVGLPSVDDQIKIRVKTSYEMNFPLSGLLKLYGECEVSQEEVYDSTEPKAVNLLHALHKFNLLSKSIVRMIGNEFNFNAFEYCDKEGIIYRI